jgi:hypothetical protein
MRNIKISLAALFLLLGLAACDKTPPYVAGRVLEAGTDKPIADARIFLTGCTGRLFGSLDCKVVDSTRTAEDGTYRINHITPELADLVTAVAPGYFSDLNSQASVPGDEFNPNINVTLYPHAWIRYTLKNQSGAYMIYQSDTPSNNGIVIPKGEQITYKKLTKGNLEYNVLFAVYSTVNSPIQSLDSVLIYDGYGNKIYPDYHNSATPRFGLFLPGHDTTDVTIIY